MPDKQDRQDRPDSGLATNWTVAEIQKAIVRHTAVDESIPNVSFGFFKRMECDLVQVSDAGYLHEYEIKRSWGDFMADFRKEHFHDDVRIMHLTFVLPAEFAGEKLKKWCAAHYKEFKRSFDFMFYLEDGPVCLFPQAKWVRVGDFRSTLQLPEQFRTETYITPEMTREIRRNDKDAPYRRKLFLEEIVKLYRLGVVRLWHRSSEKEAAQSPLEEPKPADKGLPAGVRAATEEEVESGDATWCKVCERADCAFSHRDALVHGCSRMVTKDGLKQALGNRPPQ